MAVLQGSSLAVVDAWVSDKNGVIDDLAIYQSAPVRLNSVFDTDENMIPVLPSNYYPQSEVTFKLYIDIMGTPYEDLYNRFYFIPTELNFGAITADTKESVYVWNANIFPSVIDSYAENNYAEENNVSNTFSEYIYPMGFFEQEMKKFDVSVDSEGSPEFNFSLTLSTSLGDATLAISGYRSVIFSLSPHKEFTHTYEFQTRVTQSYETEQRALLSEDHFEYFTYEARVGETQRAYYRQLLNSGTLIRFSIPVWEDYIYTERVLAGESTIQFPIGELESRSFYVGHSLVMWSDAEDYEQAKIVEIDYELGLIHVENPIKSHRSNFFTIPVRSGINDDDLELSFKGVNSHHFDCEFRLTELTEPIILESKLEYVEDKPILTFPNFTSDGRESFGYQRDEFQGVGGNKHTYINRGVSDEIKSYTWQCFDRSDFDTLRDFIFTIKGRYKSFFLPRFGREFILEEPTNINDSQFSISLGNFRYNLDEFEGQALFIQDKQGNKYFGKINTVTSDKGIISVSCDVPIKFQTDHNNLIHICIADLVRSTQDKFEVKFEDVNDISCKIATVKVRE